MKELKDVLKELRNERNYTQIQIANKIGITQQTYANYENGKREPSIDILIKLADIFNVSLDILTGRYERRK